MNWTKIRFKGFIGKWMVTKQVVVTVTSWWLRVCRFLWGSVQEVRWALAPNTIGHRLYCVGMPFSCNILPELEKLAIRLALKPSSSRLKLISWLKALIVLYHFACLNFGVLEISCVHHRNLLSLTVVLVQSFFSFWTKHSLA